FTAKPGYDYTYEIVALRGTPAHPTLAETVSARLETETTAARPGSPHHVHFNRGAAASQEYTRRFGDKRPEQVGPAAVDCLSRGAAEAIAAFIERAVGPGWGLRVSAYEFTDDHVLRALKSAATRQADVRVLYHAKNDSTKVDSEKKIQEIGLAAICEKRDAKGLSLSHDKVIVLTRAGTAQAVLTGSTNFSEGGVYGHSDVVHVCEDAHVAGEYLWLWTELEKNLAVKADAPVIAGRTPLPPDPGAAGVTPIFSPRPDLAALEWYAGKAKAARDALFMT